jgi:hypothetical protein
MAESMALCVQEEPTARSVAPPLSLLARIWMSFDGTISSLLQAAAGEAIVSQILTEPRIRPFGQAEEWAPAEGAAMERIVLRRGARTGIAYYHAQVTIALGRVSPDAQRLFRTEMPFAAALRRLNIDTTYCPVASRCIALDELAPLFDLPQDAQAGEFLYDVKTTGLAIARIREVFPLERLPMG